MIIEKEEQDKLLGKFIGKNSRLISKVSVIDFNFEEISISHNAQTDNINGNIIHARYHEDEAISKATRTPEKFDDELISQDMQPPLMIPVDFTEDWMKEKFTHRKKSSSAFENEEDALAEINKKFSDILGEKIEVDTSENEKKQMVSEEIEMELPEIAKDVKRQLDEEEAIKHAQDDEGSADFNQAEKATDLKDLGSVAVPSRQPSDELPEEAAAAIKSQDATMDIISEQINSFNKSEANDAHIQSVASDDFVPLDTASKGELREVDQDSVKSYLTQKELDEIRQKAYDEAVKEVDLEQIKTEAKSRGFQEGFKQGEEKASLSAKSEMEDAVSKVASLVDEFEKLKFNILDNVQENFHEVTQAICEAVLEREVQLDPSKFSDVIQSAIKQTIDTDQFKIRVNPEKLSQLEGLDLGSLTGKFVADEELSADQFKVDSDLTSVSSSIKDVILDLLEKADLQLFDQEEDETTDKVG